MSVDDPETSFVLRVSYDGGYIVLKCPRCKKDMINCENLEEWGQKLKKLLGSSAKSITSLDYERGIEKSFKCPKCRETIWLTEIVTPSRELAPIDRSSLSSKRNSEAPVLLDIKDIKGMLLVGTINTIVGIVGLAYRSPWAFALLPGLPMLTVALLEYKDYKRVGWVPRIATVIACVLWGLFAVLCLVVAFALLPIFVMLLVYLLLVNLVFIVPLFGELWSPGKYGGYTLLPQPLVWAVRICLALIGLILLFVWVFLR
jgi:phage FluMu protein Com